MVKQSPELGIEVGNIFVVALALSIQQLLRNILIQQVAFWFGRWRPAIVEGINESGIGHIRGMRRLEMDVSQEGFGSLGR